MKPTEFIVENSVIAQEADLMHADHEVQMARSQMYSAAQAAIEIHRLLKDISELQGIEGWVASKLTLASEYLESVRDYLKYEAASEQADQPMVFAEDAANYALDSLLNEGYTGRETKDGTWRVFKDGQSVAVAGPFKSAEEANAWIKKQDKKKTVSEMASAGGTGAGGIAVSMSGGSGKPGTGKPKKIGNAAKMKKVQVGKGIY